MAAIKGSCAMRGPTNIWHNLRLQSDTPESVRYPERSCENIGAYPKTQRKCDLKYAIFVAYEERYKPAFDAINKRAKTKGREQYNIKQRFMQKQYRMREMVLQIGNQFNEGKNVTANELRAVVKNIRDHIKKNYPCIHIWGYQIHMDEATPHIHLQYNIETKTKDGFVPNCTQGLKSIGIENKSKTRHNNAIKDFTLKFADEYRDILIAMGYNIDKKQRKEQINDLVDDHQIMLKTIKNEIDDRSADLRLLLKAQDEYNQFLEDPDNPMFADFVEFYTKKQLSEQLDHDMEQGLMVSAADLRATAR